MTEEESNTVLSSKLPYLVVEALLQRLDIFAWKTLRQVCKSTKAWIDEHPEFLRHFPVVINTETRIHEVLAPTCQVPWCHFVFSKKLKCVSHSEVKKFIAKYGETVRILEFNWSPEKMQHELKILEGCPNLEYFKSNQLCLSTLVGDGSATSLLDNWHNLRHFHVQRFRGGGPHNPLTEMNFFDNLLSTCVDLKTLTIPQFSYDYEPLEGFDYSESFVKLVISPLISYIQTRRVEAITVPYYGLTDELFQRLGHACRTVGTVLLNVRSTFLKSLAEDQLNILEVIGSLDGVTDAMIRSPLPNVQRICFVNPSFHIENHSYVMPPFPSLVAVEIDFKFSRKSQKSMELFVHRLGKLYRPTVKSLKITYQPGPPVIFPINISPLDLASSFVNLRVLHIKDWEGEDEQFMGLWERVTNVIELALVNCRNLSDRGILGDNPLQAPILQLQYLRKLSIINYLYVDQRQVNITEMSFIHAFRYMRLKSFHFFDGNLLVTGRSIPLTAVEALWNGAFGSTIEDLILQETDLEHCDVILRKTTGKSGKGENPKRKNNDYLSRYGSSGSPLRNCSNKNNSQGLANNANCCVM